MQPDFIAGRYHVVRAVGRGGMGTVWLCIDELLHREVAIKQIGSLPGESPGDTARAMREARVAAALNHKNAVSIYDVVEHDGTTWLVMEYIPSQTLSQLLASVGRLPPQRVARIGAQVAAALASAHALRIIHRDIKPGNVLVGDDDVALISDFGIARGHQDVSLTQTGMVTGTPAFFAPELARGEEPTFASDVWALGVTLYTATEGAPPYEPQSNPLAMLSLIASQPLPPPAHAGSLTGVLAGMLQPDPSYRWTMAEALAALQEVERQGLAAGAAPPPSASRQSDKTTVIANPVEPAYEEPVLVPVASGSWSAARPVEEPPARSRGPIPFGRMMIASLALLAVIGAGALLWNTLGIGSGTGNQAGPGTTSGSNGVGGTADRGRGNHSSAPSSNEPPTAATSTGPTISTAPTTSDQPTTSAEPSTLATSQPPTTVKTHKTPKPHVSNPEDFTRTYFHLVPGDLDTGWSLIAPSLQDALGRDSYDSFWGSVDSVSVSNVSALDSGTVQYHIRYKLSDGSTSDEIKQLTLEPSGDSYLITSDTTVG